MAHPTQQRYCEEIRDKFSNFFKNKKVLDIGSLDVNGNNKYLFTDCDYIGLDVADGPNVDIVSVAHEYKAPNESFDVVMSTNALEHDIHYPKTLRRMVELVKHGGLLFFTAAHKLKEHGTQKRAPGSSNTSKMDKEWAYYYMNMNPQHIKKVLNLDSIFKSGWLLFNLKTGN